MLRSRRSGAEKENFEQRFPPNNVIINLYVSVVTVQYKYKEKNKLVIYFFRLQCDLPPLRPHRGGPPGLDSNPGRGI